MGQPRPEQRNPYKGEPPRPWLRIRLIASDGTTSEVDLLADTGNPCAVIIGQAALAKLKQRDAPSLDSNFGLLEGGWIRVAVPEVGLTCSVIAYGSDAVVSASTRSSPDFSGLLGLPLLRLAEFGGDASSFWLRSPGP